MAPKIHTAEKVAYSSIVGQSIMLLNEAGACIGQLAVLNTDDPQGIADEVVSALKAPNRHAYRVGHAVGRARGPDTENALKELAELDAEFRSTSGAEDESN